MAPSNVLNRFQTNPVTNVTSLACVRTTAHEIDVVTDAAPSSNCRQTFVIVPPSGDGFFIQSSLVTIALSDARILSNAHVATSLDPRCHADSQSCDNHRQLITAKPRRQGTPCDERLDRSESDYIALCMFRCLSRSVSLPISPYLSMVISIPVSLNIFPR